MKKSFLVFCLLISMFIISCGKSGNDGKSAAFNIEAEPTSLDPQVLTDISGFMVTNMTYEPLVRLNEKNEVVPAGAESWTKSEDGKVWTLTESKEESILKLDLNIQYLLSTLKMQRTLIMEL